MARARLIWLTVRLVNGLFSTREGYRQKGLKSRAIASSALDDDLGVYYFHVIDEMYRYLSEYARFNEQPGASQRDSGPGCSNRKKMKRAAIVGGQAAAKRIRSEIRRLEEKLREIFNAPKRRRMRPR